MDGSPDDVSPARPVAFPPVGRVVSPFDGKFGAPRQPGLVPSATGEIRFFSPWNHPDAFRGLEGFSHLWIVFYADRVSGDREPSLTVRPPRLGGNARLGVFATRSLFRPNPIGLSLVELLGIQVSPAGVSLRVGGLDLADGTPVLDVKPYLPYVEAKPDARGGFAAAAPDPVAVRIDPAAESDLERLESTAPGFRQLLLETLAADPRPAYQAGPTTARAYAFELRGTTVRFTTESDGALLVRSLGLTGSQPRPPEVATPANPNHSSDFP